MCSLWKYSPVLACSALMLAAPLPSIASVGVDIYASFDPIVKETQPAPRGYVEIWRVDVVIGNAGSKKSQPFGPYLNVWTGDRKLVCRAQTSFASGLDPNTKVNVLRFQIKYPHVRPIGEPQTQSLLPSNVRSVPYALQANISPVPCDLNFDDYCYNNIASDYLNFPPGGTPECVRLQ